MGFVYKYARKIKNTCLLCRKKEGISRILALWAEREKLENLSITEKMKMYIDEYSCFLRFLRRPVLSGWHILRSIVLI